ncbi:MAG: DUF3152 domain-containing protein [Actinomycetes bacterium]
MRPLGGDPADGPGLRSTAVRTASRPGPLVARIDLPEASPARRAASPPPGRIRHFVLRYGWRAYAVPLLTVATIAALLDLAFASSGTDRAVDATGTPERPVPAEPAVEAPATEPPTSFDVDLPPSVPPPPALGAQTYVEQGAGTVSVVDGASAVYGSGPLMRFVVEVEDGIGIEGAAFAAAVEATLGSPASWGGGGRLSFQRVGAAEAATSAYDFRVTLVSPGSMERYCPGVGTGGYTSCRYGERAVINLARWATAVPHYDGDIETYRHYVVNHEVGHALGNGHVDCPGPGQVAPVMLQQTLGLDGCVKNAWPYP